MVEKQTRKSVKILRSDNGGEYLSKEFDEYLTSEGILHQTSVPGSPQQNGLAERFNRTLMEMARSMIHGANLPKTLWGEAVHAANYLKNRCPHKGLKETSPLMKLSPVSNHILVIFVSLEARCLFTCPEIKGQNWDLGHGLGHLWDMPGATWISSVENQSYKGGSES